MRNTQRTDNRVQTMDRLPLAESGEGGPDIVLNYSGQGRAGSGVAHVTICDANKWAPFIMAGNLALPRPALARDGLPADKAISKPGMRFRRLQWLEFSAGRRGSQAR